MKSARIPLRKRKAIPVSVTLLAAVCLSLWGSLQLLARDQPGFPEGYDAVQAAPNSHRVLFENSFVRVLEVSVPPGSKEPMHHHRWPSFFLVWDTGGRTPHNRYYRADGTVRDIPSRETPVSEGHWKVTWMEPEPMHSVENAETPESALTISKRPPTVRVELKFL
jgi:hypothetical protein